MEVVVAAAEAVQHRSLAGDADMAHPAHLPLLQATRFRVLAITVAMGLCPVPGHAWSPPDVRVSLDSHWTDNELADSTRQADAGGLLGLRLRQPLGPFSVEAGGNAQRHADHAELDQSSQSLLAGLSMAPGKWENVWAHAGLFTQRYAEDYRLYDRQRLFAATGLRRSMLTRLKGRAQLQVASTRFPSYPDSQHANFRDVALTLGANASLPWPLAVDVEGAWQERRYVDLDPAVATAWLWSSLRLSRPLGERVGLRLQGSGRWQLSQSAVELDSLTANGLDPAELLFDGWQAELGLQRLGRHWRNHFTVENLWATYTAEPGFAPRHDQSLALRLGATRGLSLRQGWVLSLDMELSRRWTQSSLPLYDAATTHFRVGLNVGSL